MKKLLLLILVLSLALSLLASCGRTSPEEPKPEGCEHVDADEDGFCDKCSEKLGSKEDDDPIPPPEKEPGDEGGGVEILPPEENPGEGGEGGEGEEGGQQEDPQPGDNEQEKELGNLTPIDYFD